MSIDSVQSRYTGKERDAESGLDYFGARYYASTMGRWMSPDWADKPEAVPYSSLDNPQSLNLYTYVLNHPLSKADPDGHDPDPQAQAAAIPLILAGTAEGAEAGSIAGPVGAAAGGLLVGAGSAALSLAPKLAPGSATFVGTVQLSKAPSGPKAADAKTLTSNGQAATEKGERKGPSRNAQGHSTRYNTKKGAKEASEQDSPTGKSRRCKTKRWKRRALSSGRHRQGRK